MRACSHKGKLTFMTRRNKRKQRFSQKNERTAGKVIHEPEIFFEKKKQPMGGDEQDVFLPVSDRGRH